MKGLPICFVSLKPLTLTRLHRTFPPNTDKAEKCDG